MAALSKLVIVGLICATLAHPARAEEARSSFDVCFPGVADVDWLVFFAADQSQLSERDKLILNELIGAWRDTGGYLIGLRPVQNAADTTSDAESLLRRRADAVREYLIAGGIPSDRVWLSTSGFHVADPAPDTDLPPRVNIIPFGLGWKSARRQRIACFDWFMQNCLQSSDSAKQKSCNSAKEIILH